MSAVARTFAGSAAKKHIKHFTIFQFVWKVSVVDCLQLLAGRVEIFDE